MSVDFSSRVLPGCVWLVRAAGSTGGLSTRGQPAFIISTTAAFGIAPAPAHLRLISVPQLMPFVLAAARTGLSLIWKIVLVFEVLGSDGGVGFRISVFFQFFDIKGIFAYTTAFILVVFVFEYLILRPLEAHVLKWRQPR